MILKYEVAFRLYNRLGKSIHELVKTRKEAVSESMEGLALQKDKGKDRTRQKERE